MLVAVAVLAGCTAAGIGALTLVSALTATGLPNPGPATTFGLPFVRAAGEVAAALAVGSFLLAAFLVPPQASGVLDVAGYRAVRIGTAASGVWAVCAALLVPLTISDVSGQPLIDHLNPVTFFSLANLVNVATAWRWTALLAAVVAVAGASVLRWVWTPVLLVAALATLVPLGLTGHSAAGGSHDLATNSLLIHLFAGALWAGGLLALLVHALRGGEHADLAARRFSTVALWCIAAMAFSGVLNAFVRVTPGGLLTTAYGRLVLAKVVALGLLGAAGWLQRRYGVAALRADPHAPGAARILIRLALTEAVIFGVTFGIAVGLGRTPPPPPPILRPSIPEVKIGYDFAGPPTLARILVDWRFDVVFGTAALLFAGLYLAGVVRLRRRGDAWPVGRTIAWLLGCLTLLVATSSGMGRYMPAMLSMHMIVHMQLSMLVPILLVLGGPTTLALRALPVAGAGEPPGMREWVVAALHSRVSQFFTNPIIASAIFVIGFYGLYFSSLFDAIVGSHVGHLAMNVHFLLSGYLFYWVLIGIDPTPRPVSPLVKLVIMFAALPLHGLFGVLLMGWQQVLGETFYRSLQLSWHTDLAGDQRLAGAITWTTGELPLVIVLIALVWQWARSEQRVAKRFDRAADRDHDAELTAYNAMLSELARRDAASQH